MQSRNYLNKQMSGSFTVMTRCKRKKRISANIQTTDIQEALRIILGNGYVFKQENNYISIAKAKNSETFEIAEQLQKKT